MLETPSIQRNSPADSQAGVEPIKDQEWAKNLWTIISSLELKDKPTRDRQVREWRKHMCYWDHLQFLWWSDVIHDWRTPEQALEDFNGADADVRIDPTLYAKVINIYRAHGEVIIAAMSSSMVKVSFPPDDADNPDDILAAKSKTKLSELIQRHNYSELLQIKALFLLYNQGLVCAYNELMDSEEFGTVEKEIKEEVPKTRRNYYCPDCGFSLGSEHLEPTLPEEETADGEENVLPANNIPHAELLCPNCSSQSVDGSPIHVQPEFEDFDELASETTGWSRENKFREVLTFWGPLNVKVPAWIRRLNDSPYLILETEEHYAKMQEIYKEIADDIQPSANPEYSDRVHRTPTVYAGDTQSDLVTVKRCWLRPWAFNTLGLGDVNKEKVAELKAKFPTGVYVTIINDGLVCEAIEDKMDDHWTLSVHPLSDTIHAKPIGAPMMPVQEMTNELGNLTLENIEHSIPEVYIDSDILDWDAYQKSEARPGMNYPVTKKPGESLGNSFHEIKGGTLSREVESFADRLEKFAQFVVGSLPSVFGGQLDGGSNTAKEYEMSRTQALQRLSITWKLVTVFWTQVIGKSVNSYANYLIESENDERWTENKGGGSFVNVWVRHAHLSGKTGNCYAEGSESLPVSWNEKRSMILGLIQMQNPMVESVISDPENAGFIARLIGTPELYIPGDLDRNKQLNEIAQMISEEALEEETGKIGLDGQPETQIQSTVQIEVDLDNHGIEAEVCANWLKSDVGQEMKRSSPGVYANVLAHYRNHREAEKMMAMTMAPQNPEEEGEEKESEDIAEVGAHA